MFGLPIDECPLSVFLKARDSRICVRSPEWIILSDSRGLLIFQDESVGLILRDTEIEETRFWESEFV